MTFLLTLVGYIVFKNLLEKPEKVAVDLYASQMIHWKWVHDIAWNYSSKKCLSKS